MDRDSSSEADLARTVVAELARQAAGALEAGLHVVATPIGNLGDITLRALSVLARCDVICCEDTRHSRTLLAHYAIRRPLRAYHEHNAEAERPRLLGELSAGRRLALISDAGTPLVSDPGYKLVRAAVEAGHRVWALPGASALLCGLVASGLPSDAVLYAGFLPVKDGARKDRLAELAGVAATLVFFEAPTRLARTLTAMAERLGSREVVMARELTKRFEEVRRGTASELAAWAAAAEIKGEIVLLVAPPGAAAEASDAAIAEALGALLSDTSLKDASRAVAEKLGVARSRVYDIGLGLKAGRG